MKKLSLISLAVLTAVSVQANAADTEFGAESLLNTTPVEVGQPVISKATTKADIINLEKQLQTFEEFDHLAEFYADALELIEAAPQGNSSKLVMSPLAFEIRNFYNDIAASAIADAVSEAKDAEANKESKDIPENLSHLKNIKNVTDKMILAAKKAAKELKDEDTGKPTRLIFEELNKELATLRTAFDDEVKKLPAAEQEKVAKAATTLSNFVRDSNEEIALFTDAAAYEHNLNQAFGGERSNKPVDAYLRDGASRWIDNVANTKAEEDEAVAGILGNVGANGKRTGGSRQKEVDKAVDLLEKYHDEDLKQDPAIGNDETKRKQAAKKKVDEDIGKMLLTVDIVKEEIELNRRIQRIYDDKQNLRILENRLSINQHEIRLNQHDLRLNQHDLRIGILEQKFEKLDKKVDRVAAQAAAMAAIDFSNIGVRKVKLGAGLGWHNGTSAVAVGIATAPTANWFLNAKASATPKSNNTNFTFGVGATYEFGY